MQLIKIVGIVQNISENNIPKPHVRLKTLVFPTWRPKLHCAHTNCLPASLPDGVMCPNPARLIPALLCEEVYPHNTSYLNHFLYYAYKLQTDLRIPRAFFSTKFVTINRKTTLETMISWLEG